MPSSETSDDWDLPRSPIWKRVLEIHVSISEQDFETKSSAWVERASALDVGTGKAGKPAVGAIWKLTIEKNDPKPKTTFSNFARIVWANDSGLDKYVLEFFPPNTAVERPEIALLRFSALRGGREVGFFHRLLKTTMMIANHWRESFGTQEIRGIRVLYRNLIKIDDYPEFRSGPASLGIGKMMHFFTPSVFRGNIDRRSQFQVISEITGETAKWDIFRFSWEDDEQGFAIDLGCEHVYPSRPFSDLEGCLAEAHEAVRGRFLVHFSDDARNTFKQSQRSGAERPR